MAQIKSLAYYNEIDPYAVAWLRNLIAAGAIAPGVVDSRSIEDVRPEDLYGFTQWHFFAGLGGWSLALRAAGWDDSRPVATASCPCQPFSRAGKGAGFADKRHLWPACFHILRELRPGIIFGEQVSGENGRAWIDLVQTDLEATGYRTAAYNLCAAGSGSPHVRQRLYWVGDTNNPGIQGHGEPESVFCTQGREAAERYTVPADMVTPFRTRWEANAGADGKSRMLPHSIGAGAHDLSGRMGRLRAYGNAIVAEVAADFIRSYMEIAA